MIAWSPPQISRQAEALLCAPGQHRLQAWHHQGSKLALILSNKHHLFDQGAGDQLLLERCRLNVFSTAEHNRVLGTTRQHDRPIGQEHAQITGIKPAIGIQHFCSGLWTTQIPGHHLRTTHQDNSTVAKAEGLSCVCIHDPKLRIRHGLTGAPANVAPWTPATHHRAGFSKAVAHQQLNPHGLKKGIHMRSDRSSSINGKAQLTTAELQPQFWPDQLGGQSMGGPAPSGFQARHQTLTATQGHQHQIATLAPG